LGQLVKRLLCGLVDLAEGALEPELVAASHW
jgi:hypothetical protein